MAGTNIKDIRHRIKSVESTRQITKAMELVASSKLRRAKERAETSRPYFELLARTVAEIAEMNTDFESPYTTARPVKNTLYLVIAGDRGLAGGYNGNVFRAAAAQMQSDASSVLVIGRKACEHFAKLPFPVVAEYTELGETIDFKTAGKIAAQLIEEFRAGRADAVKLIYTKFISPLRQEVQTAALLPIAVDRREADPSRALVLYEPDAAAVFDRIVPDYFAGMIFGAIVESFAAEQGARRTAMESANDNAAQMIDDLTLRFNRARQTAITQEITEIVSGANANG